MPHCASRRSSDREAATWRGDMATLYPERNYHGLRRLDTIRPRRDRHSSVRPVSPLPTTLRGRNLRRRTCAAVTLVCYALTAFGVPLPAAPVRKGVIPFPCQARA